MRYSFAALVFVVDLVIAFPLLGDETVDRKEQATRLVEKLVSADAPGIQYILVDKDSTIFSHCSGMADIENKAPLVTGNTLSAFSMTKTLTAIAVLQLAESKKIDIDDRISKYTEHPYSHEITIRQCIAHTAGIPNPIPLKWVHLADNHGSFDENQALAKVLADNPKQSGSPGKGYAYSNIGYWLLGKVIEAVSEQSYAEYMVTHIFQPLGLTPDEIGFVISDAGRQAKGYLKKNSMMDFMKGFITDKDVVGPYEGNWLRINDVYINGPAFGGAIGSAGAFGRILQDLLAEKSVLLDGDSKALLYSPQKTSDGKYIQMTLGWHIGSLKGVEYFYKEGGGAGFHCEMRVYPTKGVASVIMTNQTAFNSRKQLSHIDEVFIIE